MNAQGLPASEKKAAVRREMRERLSSLSAPDRAERSHRLVRRLAALPQWRAARRVLLFSPLLSEPDVDLLWTTGHLVGKQCAYPRIDGDQLTLCEVATPADLQPGRWSLREPPNLVVNRRTIANFDLLLVPGLAYTASGSRLGRGGGFYDRLFCSSAAGPLKIGLAFAFQLRERLPVEPHDVAVDLVITDAAS